MNKKHKNNSKNSQKYANILGIDLLSTHKRELLSAIEEKIAHNIKFSILTPNPELVLMANKNSKLREIVNRADFTVPDGIALLSAEKFLNTSINKSGAFYLPLLFFTWLKCFYVYPFDRKMLKGNLSLIKGRELFVRLIEMAHEKHWKVFLLGGVDNEAELAAKHLTSLYPNILISSFRGPKLDEKGNPVSQVDIKLERDVVDRINKFAPDLLFVAFGNPKQEIWIYDNLPKLNVKGAMAVGGTFRYIAGLSELPPRFMENLGLEWLWRLVTEPNRIGRIWNAVVVFPFEVVKSKLRNQSI